MRNDFCSNYLEHSAKGTTWSKGTTYLKKVPMGNGKYYYIYTQAQLNAWNKRNSGSNSKTQITNAMTDAEKNKRSSAAATSITSMASNGFKVKGSTKEEKQKNLENNIKSGEETIKKSLTSESSSSKSSKKGSGSSSKDSSKKNIGKAKGGSGSSSKDKASKEKSTSSKASTATKKAATEKTTKKKTADNTPINLDTLKKVYGKEDSDVTTHNTTASEFKNTMLSKYKEGSFGYLMAGSTAYKWTIENGDLVIKDYDTDKEVSFDTYLKDVKEFKEFQTNNKKKN